jgi:hypothetical protein
MEMTEKQIEELKMTRIRMEMDRCKDCDIIIKQRDGIIQYGMIQPKPPEIRMDFSIIMDFGDINSLSI